MLKIKLVEIENEDGEIEVKIKARENDMRYKHGITSEIIEEIKKRACKKCTYANLPGMERRLYDTIVNNEYINRGDVEYLLMLNYNRKYSEKTLNKLRELDAWNKKIRGTELEIENEFTVCAEAIKEYSKFTINRIKKALFVLYDELNLLYPMNDWEHDYLSLNSGRKIKNILNYCDSDGNTFCGVSIQSLRIIEEKELEKELC